MTNEQYEIYGLIGQILAASSYHLEQVPHVAKALDYLATERLKYEAKQNEGHAVGAESEAQESPKPRKRNGTKGANKAHKPG